MNKNFKSRVKNKKISRNNYNKKLQFWDFCKTTIANSKLKQYLIKIKTLIIAKLKLSMNLC